MRGPRFAEEIFPMKEISEISSKEKSVRHGHISTLHMWWARRPLASSRAMHYAALIPIPDKAQEIQSKKDFIVKLSKWENSLNRTLIEKARKDILNANDGKPPKVLDPFAGGGSMPLEALRLGCETYASEYNPVATLLLKCILEFPQKYGKRIDSKTGLVTEEKNELLGDVSKWGHWVLEETRKEIAQYYPEDIGHTPVGYLWARTISCQNPSCNAEIPLMRQYWLAKKNDKRVSLYPYVENKKVNFKLVGSKGEKIPKNFNPDKGTVAKAVAICLVCGGVIDSKTTSRLFREQKSGQRMIAIITDSKTREGKRYRLATDEDMRIYNEAEKQLKNKREDLMNLYGVDPVPDELTPEGKGRGAERAFSIRNYGMKTWGDLFNVRQKLAIITFVHKIRKAYSNIIKKGNDEEYAKAVILYLSLVLDRLVDKNSILVPYTAVGEKVAHVFVRQTLSMVWDYIELNPFTNVGWPDMQNWVEEVLEHCLKATMFDSGNQIPKVHQCTATSLPYPDNYFDAIFTDPPYYDNVPYSYLSDFFYVWLKRTIGDLFPELFSTSLTPKSKEIVAYSNVEGGFQAGKKFFEQMLKKSFQEISRVLKPDGICYIVYGHKSASGWETLINSLLDSGLVVTAAWPIDTERKQRLRAFESAALASSIYMVAGKYKKTNIGFYRNIREELKNHLSNELDKLWSEGISGADFLVSAIGSAIEVFGRYEKIIDDEGNEIRADKLLEQIRRIVTDYAVRQVLHNGFASEISQLTRFYLLWRWAYGEAKIEFDDARKLAQSIGMDLTHSLNRGLIQKDKEFIRVLGPFDRNSELFNDSNELIDVLHKVLFLWNRGKSKEVISLLQESGFGKNDTFYRVAQAISESLPNGSKEKKCLEGFLAGRARISKQMAVEPATSQRRLIE